MRSVDLHPRPEMFGTSNGWPLGRGAREPAPVAPANELLSSAEKLRDAFETHGLLLFEGLLPPDIVRRARDAYLGLFPSAFFAPGTDRADGIHSGEDCGLAAHGRQGHPAHSFVRSAPFEDLCSAPELARLASALLAKPSRMLKRRILRHFVPGSRTASRAHIDWSYLDRGTPEIITFWLPLMSCSLADGTLVYLEDSHRLDLKSLRARVVGRTDRPDNAAVITDDLQGLSDAADRKWLYADVRPGDVLVHNPWIVHASLDCASQRMRISTDLRFVPEGEPGDPRWDRDWSADDGY